MAQQFRVNNLPGMWLRSAPLNGFEERKAFSAKLLPKLS